MKKTNSLIGTSGMENLLQKNINSNRTILFWIVRLYYIATPAFFLADVLWGFDFRVPYFLVVPVWRYLYYLLCAACGVGCLLFPKATYVIALNESTINVMFLFIGFFATYFTGIKNFVESNGEQLPQNFAPKWMTAFAITGSIWVISFIKVLLVYTKIQKSK
jgi:hypothetical protein